MSLSAQESGAAPPASADESPAPASPARGETRAGRGRLPLGLTHEMRERGVATARARAAAKREARLRALAELQPSPEQLVQVEAFLARREPLPGNRPFVPRYA
jgi:hypothetical protein